MDGYAIHLGGMRHAQRAQEMKQSARALYVWVSHQQMAPHSNSSLSEP